MRQFLGNVRNGVTVLGGGSGSGAVPPRRRRRRRSGATNYALARFRCLYSSLLEDVVSPEKRDNFPAENTSDDVRGSVVVQGRLDSDGGGASTAEGIFEGVSVGEGETPHSDGLIHAPDDADVRHHRRVHALRRAASDRGENVDIVPLTYRNVLRQRVAREGASVGPPLPPSSSLGKGRPPRTDGLADLDRSTASPGDVPSARGEIWSVVSPSGEERGGGRRTMSGTRRRRSARHPSTGSAHDPGLCVAWRVLSATPSPDKEGTWAGTALAVRDDDAVAALAAARSIEGRVVDTIRTMGEMVVAARRSPSEADNDGKGNADGDEVWDYFCDRDVVGLLVDTVASEPPRPGDGLGDPSSSETPPPEPRCAGPSWTAAVKSQVLRTITHLLSSFGKFDNGDGDRDGDDVALFYLLSNHRINDLMLSLLPLPRRWTEEALEEMAPALCGLLRVLTSALGGAPHLLQFLLDERASAPHTAGDDNDDHWRTTGRAQRSNFPLLRAAVEAAASPNAQADADLHQTALHVVLDLCRIRSGAVRDAVAASASDQRALLTHLCCRLAGRYRRVAHLTADPTEGGCDGASGPERVEALRAELADLRNQLRFVDELLWCGVRALNVRACEQLLRSVLFRHVLPGMLLHRRPAGGSGDDDGLRTRRRTAPKLSLAWCASPPSRWEEPAVTDSEHVGEAEATARASLAFLVQAFVTLEYAPLLRMMAAAVLHPLSPASDCWDRHRRREQGWEEEAEQYALTQALNAIVRGRTCSPPEDDQSMCDELQQPSPQDASSWQDEGTNDSVMDEVGQPSLEAAVDNDGAAVQDEPKVPAVANLYRQSLLSLLRGDLGDRRFVPAALLLQSILELEEFNSEVLEVLGVLPDYSDPPKSHGGGASSSTSLARDGSSEDRSKLREIATLVKSPFEDALAVFFNRRKRQPSSSSSMALDRGTSLAISFVSHLVVSMTENGAHFDRLHERFQASPLIAGVAAAKIMHAAEARRLRRSSELAEAILDLFELEIGRRYHAAEGGNSGGGGDSHRPLMRCSLRGPSPASLGADPGPLLGVRSLRDPASNDVEAACFALRHVLQFRAVCASLEEARDALGSVLGPHSLGARWGTDHYAIRTVEEADREVMAVGGFSETRPSVGTDLDIRGRTFFYFSPSPPSGALTCRSAPLGKQQRGLFGRNRKLAEEMILRATTTQTELMIVLDPTELFVLRPNANSEGVKFGGNRGEILCSASLRSIITSVPDKEWLHIAIRHVENVGSLIKNGNMSLRFDSPGTCLIVRQYLERCRSALRCKLLKQMDALLDVCMEDPFSPDIGESARLIGTPPHSRVDQTLTGLVDSSNADQCRGDKVVHDRGKTSVVARLFCTEVNGVPVSRGPLEGVQV